MSSDSPPGTLHPDPELRERLERAELLLRSEGHHSLASELTLGLLHKLNNLMTGVYLNLESVEEVLDAAHPASSALRAVTDTIQKAQTLVRRTADVNLPPDGDKEYFEIGAIIQEHWELLELVLPKGATAEFTRPSTPLYVQVSSEEFREALLQLALHTRRAVVDGRARVSVSATSADELDLNVFGPSLLTIPAGVAVLYKDDSGAMPDLADGRCFQAYTAGCGGTMNQLFRAQELIQRQGGTLTARQVADGVEFLILLPAVT